MSTAMLDRPQAAPPDEVARPRLSALMRQGARRHPQRSSALFKNGQTCALGAVVVGLLGEDAPRYLMSAQAAAGIARLVLARTGVDLSQPVWLPDAACEPQYRRESLGAAILRLNDTWQWSREAIAGWLEGLGL